LLNAPLGKREKRKKTPPETGRRRWRKCRGPTCWCQYLFISKKTGKKSRKQQQQQEHHHISYSGIKNCLCFHKMKRKQFFD